MFRKQSRPTPRSKILLVDDDPAVLELLGQVFEMDGRFDVLATDTGNGALKLCKEQRPALVLLDVGLPDREGYAVCRLIKHDPECGGAWVVFLSALADQAAWDTWQKVGGDGFITKPFVIPELIATVEGYLGLGPRVQAKSA